MSSVFGNAADPGRDRTVVLCANDGAANPLSATSSDSTVDRLMDIDR